MKTQPAIKRSFSFFFFGGDRKRDGQRGKKGKDRLMAGYFKVS